MATSKSPLFLHRISGEITTCCWDRAGSNTITTCQGSLLGLVAQNCSHLQNASSLPLAKCCEGSALQQYPVMVKPPALLPHQLGVKAGRSARDCDIMHVNCKCILTGKYEAGHDAQFAIEPQH